jgi:hypothetical protein
MALLYSDPLARSIATRGERGGLSMTHRMMGIMVVAYVTCVKRADWAV